MAKTELEDLGEETDQYTESTSKLRDLVKSLTGFDILEDDNPNYVGRIGTIGQRAGNFVLQNAEAFLENGWLLSKRCGVFL